MYKMLKDAVKKDAKLKLEVGKKYVDTRGLVFGPMLPISTISSYFQDSEGAVWDERILAVKKRSGQLTNHYALKTHMTLEISSSSSFP